ncbi:Uncharacterized protein dnm_052100 [Desulfonema magnum]|uniref:Uncharacterized protein n=1 Tax=Desulfonema magnum TaxID=45655 RepID=A0A975BP93_9BACT|nr:Uncharacterized protein dnm_052100 [Desulfonema magnum]
MSLYRRETVAGCLRILFHIRMKNIVNQEQPDVIHENP